MPGCSSRAASSRDRNRREAIPSRPAHTDAFRKEEGMLQKLSHVTVWVLDQDRAATFYVDKLGFEIRTDQRLGGFRWLTVGPPGQKEIELVLLPVAKGPMLEEPTVQALRAVVEKGALCVGVL